MKLLLTSGGLRNQSIIDSLASLAGKPLRELALAIVPTASSIEDEDKGWLIDDLARFRAQGFGKIDIVDVSALPIDNWLPRLEHADVLVFEGGNTEYLLEKAVESGLADKLHEWRESKVYVGISAGSVLVCPVISPKGTAGLGWVDFLFMPHRHSAFSKRTEEDVRTVAGHFGRKTYWLDDESAIEISGEDMKIVGTGEWQVI